jgi:protein O-GlcNAc transferase
VPRVLREWIGNPMRPVNGLDSQLEQAAEMRRQSNTEGARSKCLEVLRAAPNDPRALALMAAICADQNQIEAGMRWARQAIERDPQFAPAYYALGRLGEAAEQYAQAETCYRRVTELDPHHARAHNNVGCMLHVQGRFDEALASYSRALELDPALPEALCNYTLIAGGREQLTRARQGFERHLPINPNDAAAHLQLANIEGRLGVIRRVARTLPPSRCPGTRASGFSLQSGATSAHTWPV